MTAALDALFADRLHTLDRSGYEAFLQTHALSEPLTWSDRAGRRWSALERWGYLATLRPWDVPSPDLLNRLSRNGPMVPWDKAFPADRQARVWAWLAIQRQEEGDAWDATAKTAAAEWFKRSFAKCPEGTPAAGYGDPRDGGWLAMALAAADEAMAAAPSDRPSGWDRLLTRWLHTNLMTHGHARHSWWVVGGVSGTRVRRSSVGDPGWELANELPGEGERGGSIRPRGLAQGQRWATLTTHLLHRLADRLENERDFDAQGALRMDKIAYDNDARPWHTPALSQALGRVAWAGLALTSRWPQAHLRFDGRALGALAWLLAVDPAGPWLPEPHKAQLAAAVGAHQHAWETAPAPYERAWARTPFAPQRRLPAVWEWAQACVLDRPSTPPAPTLPSPRLR